MFITRLEMDQGLVFICQVLRVLPLKPLPNIWFPLSGSHPRPLTSHPTPPHPEAGALYPRCPPALPQACPVRTSQPCPFPSGLFV